ncbi:MAG TPA: hypothetical protein PLP19_06865 [bacterium]|nr:hypothetical protein [bacterium]HPN43192.1 hypothetical protein [bacterium]
MSTPVDIPQNINIHISHAEKVVEIPHADSTHNSAQQSSLELANREAEQRRPLMKRDKRENRQFQDHFDKSSNDNTGSEPGKDQVKVLLSKEHNSPDDLKDMNIGNNIDFSV